VNVMINGTAHQLTEGSTVATAVAEMTAAATGVAAAVNGEVVRRGSWSDTPVRDGDLVEVITAVQGG
jgi:sulfur carrier protein